VKQVWLLLLLSAVSWADPSIVQIVSGGSFNCARFDDGRAKCWGYNGTGQSGVGNTINYGKADAPGLAFVDLGSDAFIEELTAGEVHACARLRGRKPKCWGNNEKEQLGHGGGENLGGKPEDIGDALPEVNLIDDSPLVELTSGEYFTCGRHKNGKVECWGSNWNGESTNKRGEYGKDDSPPGPVAKHAIANFGEGEIAGLGAGSDFVCARFTEGHVRCIGINFAGQLGVGHLEPRNANLSENVNLGAKALSLAGGQEHMCAVLEGGKLKCWGSNYYGQLGQEDSKPRGQTLESLESNFDPINLGHGLTVKAVAAKYWRTCALLSNHAVKCWGFTVEEGDFTSVGVKPGEMGDNLPFMGFSRLARVLEVQIGNGHACARLNGNRVKCVGANSEGQLGIRSDIPATRRGVLPDIYPSVALF